MLTESRCESDASCHVVIEPSAPYYQRLVSDVGGTASAACCTVREAGSPNRVVCCRVFIDGISATSILDTPWMQVFQQGDYVLREGDELASDAKFYLIASGTVTCHKTFEVRVLDVACMASAATGAGALRNTVLQVMLSGMPVTPFISDTPRRCGACRARCGR